MFKYFAVRYNEYFYFFLAILELLMASNNENKYDFMHVEDLFLT